MRYSKYCRDQFYHMTWLLFARAKFRVTNKNDEFFFCVGCAQKEVFHALSGIFFFGHFFLILFFSDSRNKYRQSQDIVFHLRSFWNTGTPECLDQGFPSNPFPGAEVMTSSQVGVVTFLTKALWFWVHLQNLYLMVMFTSLTILLWIWVEYFAWYWSQSRTRAQG